MVTLRQAHGDKGWCQRRVAVLLGAEADRNADRVVDAVLDSLEPFTLLQLRQRNATFGGGGDNVLRLRALEGRAAASNAAPTRGSYASEDLELSSRYAWHLRGSIVGRMRRAGCDAASRGPRVTPHQRLL